MIELVVKSSVILFATLCAARVLKRKSASVRHMVWTLGLVAALALPALTPLLPTLPVDLARSRGLYARVQSQTETVVDVTDGDAGVKPATTGSTETVNLYLAVWLSGSAFACLFMLASAARLLLVTMRARPVKSERWNITALEIAGRLRLRRKIKLAGAPGTGVLGTWGIFRGNLLLPLEFESWSDERIRVVLAHELAHVKRFDWVVQIIADTARAVHWFNPLFWIACKELRYESERACDDVVLNLGIDGQTYAAHLLELARSLKHSGRPWAPVLAMARSPHLERRFSAMLNPSLNRRPATALAVALATVAALTLTLPLAAMRTAEPEPGPPPVISPTLLPPAAAPPPAKPVAPRRTAMPQGRADGTLSGTISDPSGAVVPGVRVTVSTVQPIAQDGIQEIPVQSVTAGSAGDYYFAALTPGSYSLKAELPGFVTYRSIGVQIASSQTLTHNVTLQISNVAQRVVVSAPGQPKPQAFPAQPRRIRVGGNIVAANIITPVKPAYPQSARDRGAQGTVVLEGIIATDGSISGLRTIKAIDPELTNAAREAVMQWKYRPTMLNGSAVEVITSIEVVFELSQ